MLKGTISLNTTKNVCPKEFILHFVLAFSVMSKPVLLNLSNTNLTRDLGMAI